MDRPDSNCVSLKILFVNCNWQFRSRSCRERENRSRVRECKKSVLHLAPRSAKRKKNMKTSTKISFQDTMHHLYPISKGDQLCPLGFHPQVRWPTRCKRCFRDYKEHGGKRNPEDIIASSPNLSDSSSKPPARIWTSSQNLSTIPSPESGEWED